MKTLSPDIKHIEVEAFWAAPPDALFTQRTLKAVTDFSDPYFERARWSGQGPRFVKLGRSVRYRKSDVLDWLEMRPAVSSTTEAAEQFGSPRAPTKTTGAAAMPSRRRPE